MLVSAWSEMIIENLWGEGSLKKVCVKKVFGWAVHAGKGAT